MAMISRTAFAVLFCLCAAIGAARAFNYFQPNMADPIYTQCKTDDECLVIHPACSAPITVNRRHFQVVYTWYRHISQYKNCPEDMDLPKVTKKQCLKNRCTLEMTQPEPPKPDTSKQALDPHYCDTTEECTVVLGDCCVKNFVNTKSAPHMQAEIKAKENLATCFFPDRRHVKNLRCENHLCTAELEVPSELRDLSHRSKDKCEQ